VSREKPLKLGIADYGIRNKKRIIKSETITNISLAEPAEATEKIAKEPTEIKDERLVSFLCGL